MQAIQDKNMKDNNQCLSPLQRYEAAIATGNYAQDDIQKQAVTYMEEMYQAISKIEEQSSKKSWLDFFKSSPKPPKGLYMWGGVGRGKTWMMDMFFDSLPTKRKLRMHFHHFMQRVHQELNALRGQSDPLDKVAETIYNEAYVICFDEFFVSNVADAMILGNLFGMLFKKGITLVATSNIEPDGLYKNGIHRDRFLPAIHDVNANTVVMNIDAGIDYRLRALKQAKLYLSPLSETNTRWLHEQFDTLAQGHEVYTDSITINEREIEVIKRTSDILFCSFKTLCQEPRSAIDFIAIANQFSTVMIDNILPLNDVLSDPTQRFIYLVDEFYDRKVKLFICAAQPILELYQGKKLAFEIERTRSRLLEMQSEEYLSQLHHLEIDNSSTS